jgi:hypothetical protein
MWEAVITSVGVPAQSGKKRVFSFSFFGGTAFELRASPLAKQTLYCLSHTSSLGQKSLQDFMEKSWEWWVIPATPATTRSMK